MYKKTISILLLILLHIMTFTSFAEDTDTLYSLEELEWLSEHPEIKIGIMDSWPPMDYVDDLGVPRGIGVDFINLMNEKLNDRLVIMPDVWNVNYQKVIDFELDAIMDITPREDREVYFNFTKQYIKVPHEIIAKEDGPYYQSLEELSNKTLAFEKDFFIVNYMRNNYPKSKVIEYASTSDALDAVSKGEADAYIGNRAVATYIIEHELISNLQLQGKVSVTSSTNAIGVRKDWPILASILDKTLNAIPEENKLEIYIKSL